MPDRWNDPRDDRWRREPRYRQERYAREERSADDALSDYISGPSEDRSFRDDGRYYREHEHDADWDGAYNRGYDLDPYYPGGVAEPRRFDRGGYRVPLLFFRFQLAAPLRRQTVESRSPSCVGHAPLGLQQTGFRHAVEGWVERAGLHAQNFIRSLLDVRRDSETVVRPATQKFHY